MFLIIASVVTTLCFGSCAFLLTVWQVMFQAAYRWSKRQARQWRCGTPAPPDSPVFKMAVDYVLVDTPALRMSSIV